jgi:hypothetical protein
MGGVRKTSITTLSAARDDLPTRVQKSKYAGLGQENGFAPAYLHSLLRLIMV